MSSSWTRPSRTKLRRSFVPKLEMLENRVTPTGVVTCLINARGDLVITGDIHENDISFAMAGDVLTITGNNDTTLSGVGFKGDASRDFEDFNNVIIDLKSDDDTVSFADCTFPGSVTVSGSAGKDTINVGEAGGTLSVSGNLYIYGGTGDDTITLTEIVVNDNLLIDGGNGNNLVTCVGFEDSAEINVFGHMSYKGGAGKDTVTTGLTVKTAINLNLGQGINATTLDGTDVAGNLSIFGGTSPDTVTITGSSNIAGNTSIVLKNGVNILTIEDTSIFEGNLSISSGVHQDTFSLSGDIVVGGDTLINGGSNQDTYTVDTCQFFGKLHVEAGNNIAITDSLIEENLEINFAGLSDVVDVSNTSIEGDLLISTGSGEDEITLTTLDVGGVAEIVTGVGDDTVTLDGGEYSRTVLINTHLGSDIVALANASDTTFDDRVTVNLGNSDDTLDLGSGGSVNLLGSISGFYGGSGTDTLITGTIVGDFLPVGFE